MSESVPVVATPAAVPVAKKTKAAVKPAKAAAAKPKVAKSTASKHPKFTEMISAAITKLAERSGSSKQAILKFIMANYQLDSKIANQHLKLALRSGVKSGAFKQTTGIGASGSFKLSEKKKEAKKPVAPKKVEAKKPKAVAAKPKTTKAVVKPKAKSAVKPAAAKPKPKAAAVAKPKVAVAAAKPKKVVAIKKAATKEAAKAKSKSAVAKPKVVKKAATAKPKVVKKAAAAPKSA